MTEQEFGIEFVSYLHKEGYETWQEVVLRDGTIDIVAKKNGKYYGFELKTVLNDTVLIQARNNRHYFHFVYAVVPCKKRLNVSEVKRTYCEKYNIGIIGFINSRYNDTLACKESDPSMKNGKLFIESKLFDDQKESRAGSKSGEAITDFKRSITFLYDLVCIQEKVYTFKSLWEEVKDRVHWKSKSGFLKALKEGYTQECKDIYARLL